MKKNLLALLAIMGLVLTFSLTSCDSDDKDSPKGYGIVGTWKWTYSDEEGKAEVEMTFKSNGNCTVYSSYINYETGEKESDRGSGTYEYDERTGRLYLKIRFYDEMETWSFDIEINGDRMYLTPDDEDDTVKFIRV